MSVEFVEGGSDVLQVTHAQSAAYCLCGWGGWRVGVVGGVGGGRYVSE